jgi:hypothetical protein
MEIPFALSLSNGRFFSMRVPRQKKRTSFDKLRTVGDFVESIPTGNIFHMQFPCPAGGGLRDIALDGPNPRTTPHSLPIRSVRFALALRRIGYKARGPGSAAGGCSGNGLR